MEYISYFETFINSQTSLERKDIHLKLKEISKKYFRGIIKIKQLGMSSGGWEFRAKGLKDQWIKVYIKDEGYTLKIYWYNSNEFLRWVATIIMHEIAYSYDARAFSGRNLKISRPYEDWYDTFKEYIDNTLVSGTIEARQNLVHNKIPNRIKKAFHI